MGFPWAWESGTLFNMARWNRRRCLQALAAACTVPPLRAQEEVLSEAVQGMLDRQVEAARREQRIPALSIAIGRHGRIVYRAAFGEAAPDEPCTPEHRFRLASVSKPITSVVLHRLFELGRLKPEDHVFGPNGLLAQFPAPTPAHREITVHHLLTHTSGGWGNKKNDPMFQKSAMNHKELIAWTLRAVPLEARPGETYAYSNFGYCLLGRLIEAVTGESYEAATRRLVLEPCGAAAMTLAGTTRAERQPGEVVYHGSKGEDPYRPGLNVRRMDAHGGWLASAEEVLRFLVHIDDHPGAPDLLQPETLRAMTTPTEVGPNYARGWSVNARPNWWHGGSLPGTSTLAVRTASGLCWAALANTRRREQPGSDTGAVLDRLLWQVVRSVLEWQA